MGEKINSYLENKNQRLKVLVTAQYHSIPLKSSLDTMPKILKNLCLVKSINVHIFTLIFTHALHLFEIFNYEIIFIWRCSQLFGESCAIITTWNANVTKLKTLMTQFNTQRKIPLTRKIEEWIFWTNIHERNLCTKLEGTDK